LARALFNRNDNRGAAEAFERAAELGQNRSMSLYNAACGWAKARRPDDAFRCLREAIAHRASDRERLESDPDLASLRSDARWADLFRQPAR
jgi:hypothetical protein